MRIGIPTFGADHGKSGIGEYLRCLIEEWTSNQEHEFELIGPEEDRAVFLPDAPNWRFIEVPEGWCRTMPNLLWHQFSLPGIARFRAWDVLFLPAANRRLPWSAPCPTVGTVHDISHLHVPQKYSKSRHVYVERVLPRMMRRLDRVLTVSESSARDILGHARVQADRLEVIPNGARLDRFRSIDRTQAKALVQHELGFDAPFLLYVARLEHPGKNHVRLIEAYAEFVNQSGSDWHLLLIGPDWPGAEAIHDAAQASPLADRIHLPGFVSHEALLASYASAQAFVLPSLYEGFGIPLLEAMAAGLPTAAADCSSLPEVGGDSAIYFDPYSVAEMSRCLLRLAQDSALRDELSRSGLARSEAFPWSRCAAETLRAIESVVHHQQARNAA